MFGIVEVVVEVVQWLHCCICCTAPRVSNVQATIEHLYPLVRRCQRNRQEAAALSIPTGLHLLPASAASKSAPRGPAAVAAPPAILVTPPTPAPTAGAPSAAAAASLFDAPPHPVPAAGPTGRTFNLSLGESSEDDDNDTDSD